LEAERKEKPMSYGNQNRFFLRRVVQVVALAFPLGAGTTTAQSSAPAAPGWQEQARQLVAANKVDPVAAARIYALLSVAQYNAVAGPDADRAVGVSLPARESATDQERGAVAGASSVILTFFFPGAETAIQQRLRALGAAPAGQMRTAFKRGFDLGVNAGRKMTERAQSDRFDAEWNGALPAGPGLWKPNDRPVYPQLGRVTPYFLTSGAQFRPASPPAFGSPAFLTDLAEIRKLSDTRTPEQLASAKFWNQTIGTFTSVGYWNQVAARFVEEGHLDERSATRVFALLHAATMDAIIACWDAKYHYSVLRPSQADSAITLPIGLPAHPSYPSGHSCASAAAVTILAQFFPAHKQELTEQMTQAGFSRMYGGIHYRFDVTTGQQLGRAVAEWALSTEKTRGLRITMR
jgi:membrane-associated phospholipid phosphatase